MKESIYTIPVNEAFEAYESEEKLCPFCRLYKKLQENELDLILGASMMDPDIRIKTNKTGFCSKHYGDMLKKGNRLSLALMLESHLNEVYDDINAKDILKPEGTNATKRIGELNRTCYVCDRIDFSFTKMIETAVLLWKSEPEFRKNTELQPYICLPHFERFLQEGKARLGKKEFPIFFKSVKGVTMRYYDTLREDVSWFCKKFDYRYNDEPWGNAKDSPERAISFLGADTEYQVPKNKE